MILQVSDFNIKDLIELLPIMSKLLSEEPKKGEVLIPLDLMNWLIKHQYISVIPDTEYVEDAPPFGFHLEQTKEGKDETKQVIN